MVTDIKKVRERIVVLLECAEKEFQRLEREKYPHDILASKLGEIRGFRAALQTVDGVKI